MINWLWVVVIAVVMVVLVVVVGVVVVVVVVLVVRVFKSGVCNRVLPSLVESWLQTSGASPWYQGFNKGSATSDESEHAVTPGMPAYQGFEFMPNFPEQKNNKATLVTTKSLCRTSMDNLNL